MRIKAFRKVDKDKSPWVKAVATVHASSREILAWVWFYCSIHRMKLHQKKEGNVVRQSSLSSSSSSPSSSSSLPSLLPLNRQLPDFLDHKSTGENHIDDCKRTQHIVVQKTFPLGFDNRQFNIKFVWESLCDDDCEHPTTIMAYEPFETSIGGDDANTTRNERIVTSRAVSKLFGGLIKIFIYFSLIIFPDGIVDNEKSRSECLRSDDGSQCTGRRVFTRSNREREMAKFHERHRNFAALLRAETFDCGPRSERQFLGLGSLWH